MSSDVPGPQGDRGKTGDEGERGKTGDVGPTGPTGHLGRSGVAGDPGPRGLPGKVAPIAPVAPRRSPLGSVLRAAAALCFAVALLMAMIFSHQELDRLRAERTAEQAAKDCLALYAADIDRASAAYDSELGDLFATIVLLPPPLDEKQRTANREATIAAVALLTDKNVPYHAALDAYDRYAAMDPPPARCPHP